MHLIRSGASAPRGPGIAVGDPILPFTARREGNWTPSQGQRKCRGKGGKQVRREGFITVIVKPREATEGRNI
eukprot:4735503-Pyramimonas_sp.AAC.1